LFSFFAQHDQNSRLSILLVNVDDDVTGWLTNPGCFLWLKEATATSLGQPLEARVSEVQRVLLATFSNSLTDHFGKPSPPFPHFDPFGTEFREPGRDSHPVISDFRLSIVD